MTENHFIDPYINHNSLVHRLDAPVKLVLMLTFIVITALIPAGMWAVYILLFSLALAVTILSEIDFRIILKRSALALPFMLAALPLLFTTQGTILVELPLGFTTLHLSQPGLVRFISLAGKTFLSIQAALLLSATTPLPEISGALAALGVPRTLAAIINLMWRYLFVIIDETVRLLRARSSRSSKSRCPGLHSGASMVWRARVTGGMAGSLFLRSYERSERIYQAMQSRGYDGTIRTLPQHTLPPRMRLLLSSSFLALLAVLLLGFFFSI